MIDLQIDGQSVDIAQNINVALTLSIADITNIDSSSTGYSKTLSIPMTPKNRRILGFTEQVFSKEQFNNAKHTAQILSNGITVMSGYAQMKQYTNTCNGSGEYSLNIIGDSFDWLMAAEQPLNSLETPAPDVVVYEDADVYENSIRPVTDSPMIRFIPVDKGALYTKNASGAYKRRTELVFEDYHPFLNVWRLLEQIMKGYVILCPLENILRNTYISGSLSGSAQETNSLIQKDNDFYAGTNYEDAKFESTTNELKRNVFNSWTYLTSDGSTNYFTTGNILSIVSDDGGGVIRFTPTETVRAAFEIQMSFESGIASDGSMIDSITFGSGNYKYTKGITIEDSSLWADSENGFPTEQKLLILYCNGASNYKRLVHRFYSAPKTYTEQETIGYFYEGLNVALTMKSIDSLYDVWVLERNDGKLEFFDSVDTYYVGNDFAIIMTQNVYGVRWLDTDSLSVPFSLSFTTYMYKITDYIDFKTTFKNSRGISVYLRVGNDTTIKPSYSARLAWGEDTTLENVGSSRTCLEFLQELRSLFNLMFYTNSVTKEVFISPRSNFYIDKL